MSYIGQQLPADVFSGFVTDIFTGDGSATTFTLSKAPFSEDTLIVVINNVIQKPTTNFTVSGTTLTIVGTAVADGDVIYAIHTGGAIPITTPGDNSVTSAKLSGNLVTPGTLDMNGQELILDADADTSITADTDDKIDFKCGGLDTIQMNKFGQVVHKRDSATTFGGSTLFQHQRGTLASPSIVNSGDTIGTIATTVYDGTAYLDGPRILFQVDGTPGDDDMPSRITFQTTIDGSAGTLAERMRINNTGHVSITSAGTSSGGSDTAYGLYLTNAQASNPNGFYYKSINGSPDSNSLYAFTFQDSSTNRCLILSSGDIINHDGDYGTISDERIKQDIRDANSQWDDIKNIRIRNFKKKDDVRQYGDDAWEQIGVVAQELETVCPKLIRKVNPSSGDIISDPSLGTLYTADDVETQGDNPTAKVGDVKEIKEKIKAVGSSIIYMKAIKALQEAMAKIETLETKVKALEDA